jgi:hypothetical protein
MKISIGSTKDKNISSIVELNIEAGLTVYTDGIEYFIDVLNEDKVYRSPDAIFASMPDGEYLFIKNNIYLVE